MSTFPVLINTVSKSTGLLQRISGVRILLSFLAFGFLLIAPDPAHAAGIDFPLTYRIAMPATFMFLLFMVGLSISFISTKRVILFAICGWIAAFVILVLQYDVEKVIDRGGLVAMVLLFLTASIAAGWWLGRRFNNTVLGD